MSEKKSYFLELLDRHDEFVFTYNGVAYEIVNGNEYGNGPGISLYLSNNPFPYGTFIQSFSSKDDFLINGNLEGKNILAILNDIKV